MSLLQKIDDRIKEKKSCLKIAQDKYVKEKAKSLHNQFAFKVRDLTIEIRELKAVIKELNWIIENYG